MCVQLALSSACVVFIAFVTIAVRKSNILFAPIVLDVSDMPNIAISKKAHTELQKIKGEFMAQNGKDRSFDDVIMELVKRWKDTK